MNQLTFKMIFQPQNCRIKNLAIFLSLVRYFDSCIRKEIRIALVVFSVQLAVTAVKVIFGAHCTLFFQNRKDIV